MFNEYYVYQMMKHRQKETEKVAKNAWKYFSNSMEKSKDITAKITNPVNFCCHCACA